MQPFIASKADLLDYIKKRCGYPVINVEVTDDQMEICIQEALEKFVEQAEGGIQFRFMTLEVTPDVHNYSLDYDVHAVIQVYDYENSGTDFEAPFPDKVIPGLMMSWDSGTLLTVELTRQALETLDFMLRRKLIHEFNPVTRQLYFPVVPIQSPIGLTYYQRTDYSDTSNSIFDNKWVKNYSFALTLQQWGTNLIKFEGSLLPSGLSVNAARYLDEGKEMIEKLDTELDEVWSLPANFILG